MSNPQPDPQTTRYYCEPCFSPTFEEQLRLAGKEMAESYLEIEEPELIRSKDLYEDQ